MTQETIHVMENLKRLIAIWRVLATHTQLSEFVTEADMRRFETRAQGEGITFLTSTLPSLYKALDRSFATGKLDLPVGFKKSKRGDYPLFLEKAWETLFTKQGTLKSLSRDQAGAVSCIRQLSAIFYKLEMPYTVEQESDTICAFLQAEDDLSQLSLTSPPTKALLRRARRIVCRLLAGVNPLDIRPRHGSGSSACRVKPWERYESFRFIPRLHEVYPYDSYFYYNLTHLCDELHKLEGAEEAEPPARVVFVPKDSRGPRLISCEPREFMFIQQGLMNLMYETVQRHPAIARQIGFTDQTRNQRMATQGSKDQSYATLDLKEASDRVSLELVRTIFPDNWVKALTASRSKATTLPDGTIVPLDKFAPMGSACCFPVEAICFWAISLAAVYDEGYVKRLFQNRLIKSDMRMSVFGDDIIVPTEHYQSVCSALEQVGLQVNQAKSFREGPFRESCGRDAFLGENVTPVRVKHTPADNTRAKHRTADLFNNLICKYGHSALGCVLPALFQEWYGPVPLSNRYKEQDGQIVKLHQGLTLWGRYTQVPSSIAKRWNSNLQRQEFLIQCEVSQNVKVLEDRWSQVMRRELQELSEQTAADRKSVV